MQIQILEKAMSLINNDQDLSILNEQYEKKDVSICGLLSSKPKLYVCNVDEESISEGNKYTNQFIEKFGEDKTMVISADIENQINDLGDEMEKKNLWKC